MKSNDFIGVFEDFKDEQNAPYPILERRLFIDKDTDKVGVDIYTEI